MSEKMSIEEYKEKMEELFDECEKVLAQFKGDTLAELKESKKEGKWKPKKGEIYWYRNDIGAIDFDEVCNTTAHDWQLKNSPIFKTKEECERYWHFMDTVKEKSYEFSKEEWTNKTIAKYIIQYDYLREYFYVDKYSHVYTLGTIYFKTKESAQYIIDNFKDELMEYFV